MRGRLIGFAFMTLCLSLMLGALVVFCGEPEQEVQPPRVAAAIIAAPPADGAAYVSEVSKKLNGGIDGGPTKRNFGTVASKDYKPDYTQSL